MFEISRVDSISCLGNHIFLTKKYFAFFQRVPQLNSVWQGEEVHAMTNVDISVAVATKSGLITPIVKNTPFLSVDQISEAVKVR